MRKKFGKINPRARSLHYIQPWSTIVISSSSSSLNHNTQASYLFNTIQQSFLRTSCSNTCIRLGMKKTATTQKNQLYASEGCQVKPSHTKLLTPFHGIFLIAHFASISSGRPSILISLIENNVKASFPSNCYFFLSSIFLS